MTSQMVILRTFFFFYYLLDPKSEKKKIRKSTNKNPGLNVPVMAAGLSILEMTS